MIKVWTIVILSIFVFVLLTPIYWSIATAFKPPDEIMIYPPTFFPRDTTLIQFGKLFTAGEGIFVKYIYNTFIMVLITMAITLPTSLLGGYAFSKLAFKGSNFLFLLVLSIMMVPFQSLLIPLYNLLNKLNLLDTKLGLSLVYSTFFMPFCIFIMRTYFSSLPTALRESAVLDGASELKILFKVYTPLSLPAIATSIVYLFLETWNDFILSLIFSSSSKAMNAQVGITIFAKTRFTQDWGLINAGCLITMIPPLLLFLFLQRYYISGLVSGTLKE